MLIPVKFGEVQKYIALVPSDDGCSDFDTFHQKVTEKLGLPLGTQLHLTDETGTEVEADVFGELLERNSTIIVRSNGGEHTDYEREKAKQMALNAIQSKAEGQGLMEEYYQSKKISEKKRIVIVNQVVAKMMEDYGFLDTPGLIEQDFAMMFGEEVSNRFLSKWPTFFKNRVLEECEGLYCSDRVDALLTEDGWDSDLSSVLLLVHMLPPAPKGIKKSAKISAAQAIKKLVQYLQITLCFLLK
uniref:Uncharacterized protein n=1 Tax=Knipowitschia caucasica TaxID=637954 RepID=A0AAV2MHN6_KNICA